MGYHPDSEHGGGLAARLRRVRDSGDRRATAGLVDLLRDGELDIPAIDALCSTLTALEDLRVVPDLEALLADRTRAPARREAALEILAGLPREDPTLACIRAWARSPDALLRAHGATFLDAADGSLIATLLRDPHAVVRRAASRSLVGLARTPQLVTATRDALRDDDPIVREWACQAAYMDEPMAVLFDVLRLLADRDDAVRRAAFDAVGEYPSVSAVLALADARSPRPRRSQRVRDAGDVVVGGREDDPHDPLDETDEADAADEILSDLLFRVARSLATWTTAEARLTRWIGPARWVLDEYAPQFASRSLSGGETRASVREPDVRPPVALDEARAVLLDPDAPARAQREALAGRDWSRTGPAGLALLEEVEPQLSGYRTRRALSEAWADLARTGAVSAGRRLEELAVDGDTAVRHAALSALVRADDARAVPAALATLASRTHRSLAGDTAVAAIATLAPTEVAERTLIAELTRADDADGLRLGVIHQVERLGLVAAIPHLVALAAAPVTAGVGAHVTALRALRSLGCRTMPPVAHLLNVDHLHVQRELGAWGARGGRFG